VGVGIESGFRSWTGKVVTVCAAIKFLRISPRLQLGAEKKILGTGELLGRTGSPECWVRKNWKWGKHRWVWVCGFALYPSTAAALLGRKNLACRHSSHDTHAIYSD
jgi:hypothetical protein